MPDETVSPISMEIWVLVGRNSSTTLPFQPSQGVDQMGEIGRPRRLEAELALKRRVEEAEHARMQRLPRESRRRGKGFHFFRRARPGRFACPAICRISHQRV